MSGNQVLIRKSGQLSPGSGRETLINKDLYVCQRLLISPSDRNEMVRSDIPAGADRIREHSTLQKICGSGVLAAIREGDTLKCRTHLSN